MPVESQACGTPVVALDDGGARETVIDGETGVLVPEPTAEAFADGLNRAMHDPVRPRRRPRQRPAVLETAVHRVDQDSPGRSDRREVKR